MKKKMKYVIACAGAMFVLLFLPAAVNAQVTIPASQDETGKQDYRAIIAALESDGDIVLESGSTYYIKASIYVQSNQKITATGATIISQSGAVRNKPTAVDYGSIDNFTLIGGTWKNVSADGYKKSMIQFSHGKNIRIQGVTVLCNYTGHAMELIACKNVMVDRCSLLGVGSCPSTCVEEQLQIDLATPVTAPTIAAYGAKYVKGQTCANITVKDSKIRGGRGICSNYAAKETKYQTKFHKNITITGNTIEGLKSEAVALFNVVGATVKNNKITTKSSRTGTAYSVGLHLTMFGKAPSSMKSAAYVITGNTIKGGRQGLFVFSHSVSKFGKVTVKNNKCYAKNGKASALVVTARCVGSSVISGNKTYTWK